VASNVPVVATKVHLVSLKGHLPDTIVHVGRLNGHHGRSIPHRMAFASTRGDSIVHPGSFDAPLAPQGPLAIATFANTVPAPIAVGELHVVPLYPVCHTAPLPST
jgi:hypothetical protein